MEHSPATLMVAALNGRNDEPCIRRDEGDLSYREVRALVSQYRQALAKRSVAPGATVGLLGANTVEMLLVMTALTLCGTTRVPMNARGSLEDHAFLLADSGAGVLVYDAAEFGARAQELAQRHPSLILVPYGSDGADTLGAVAAACDPQPMTRETLAEWSPSDLALIGYTGGTTGGPKGVRSPNSVQAWMTIIQLAEWDWPDTVTSTVVTPLSHSGMVVALTSWLRGGSVHVLEGRFSAERFFDAVARHRITTTLVVPTIIYALLDSPALERADLSSLETVFYGSAPMAPARLAEAIRRIGPVFSQFYGQSEAPMTVCTMPKRDHDPDDLARLASCGRPVPWIEVSLRDEDGPVADGQPGEICVRGPLVMDGYQNRPEETAAALAGGWLLTGDIARRDPNGFLTIVDRKKDMVISGGFNVYPREVEGALERHPAVGQVAVIGVPDERWGEAVHAVVALREGRTATADELIAHVKSLKGSVQAPKSIEFRAELPLTAVGKVDKKALRTHWTAAQTSV